MKCLQQSLLLCFLLATCTVCAEPQVSASQCNTLTSLDGLGKTHRIALLGEMHGTKEIPAYFFDVICTATLTLPVEQPIVVGLEYYAGDNISLQTFLKSDGGEIAVRALLNGEHWNTPMKDGRTSAAMLELIDKLRTLTQERKNVSVLAFDPVWPYPPGITRDQGMADNIEQAIAEQPSAVLVALVGDYHARVDDGNRNVLAAKLKSAFRSYRFVFNRGSSWICDGPRDAISCGARTIEENDRPKTLLTRALTTSDMEPGYHGAINLVTVSASDPAKPPQIP